MKINFKRLLNNYFIYLCIIINCLMVGLGYVLLVALDDCTKVNAKLLIESVYSVYTQFGLLMLCPLFIYQIYIDYKEKNILFYKQKKYNAISYFFSKIGSEFIIIFIGAFTSSFFTCLIAKDFKFIFIQLIKCTLVMLYYLIISSFFAFVFDSYIISFFVNLAFWLIGIIVSSVAKVTKFLAYFDSSGKNFKDYIFYINGKTKTFYNIVFKDIIYDLVVFFIVIILVLMFKKRWVKNGI